MFKLLERYCPVEPVTVKYINKIPSKIKNIARINLFEFLFCCIIFFTQFCLNTYLNFTA